MPNVLQSYLMTREHIRILLVEARLDQAMIDHEKACLLRAGHLSPEQIVPVSILPDGPVIDLADGYDAVILGGTGDYSVVQDHPSFYEPLLAFVHHLLDKSIPTLGLCYGHQLMGQAFCGRVETHHDRSETGTYQMFLTESGVADPLLKDLPWTFLAQQGHHDMVMDMPSDFTRLAFSFRCPWQAMKHKTKPMYGFQFHPELCRDDLVQRMRRYASTYADTAEKLQEVIDAIKETDNQSVIANFIDCLVCPSKP